MGCPPDPGDVSIWHSNEERSKAESRLKELDVQKENTLKLFEQVKALLLASQDLSELIAEITQAIDEPVAKLKEPYCSPDDPYRDVQEAIADLDLAKEKLKNRENSLCVIRDGLLKLSAYIPQNAVSANIKSRILKERELHLEHREDDRRTWLKWLDDKIGVFKYYLEKATTKKKDSEIPYLNEGIQKLEKEKIRVQAITPEDLILNRNLFGRNEAELDISFPRIRNIGF